jgi:uncharacterized membrane protein
MLHPATVHFAIVLPLVASIFGVIYIFTRSEGMSKISSRATLIAALAVIGVWYTGNDAGKHVYDFLSAQGKAELLEHKALGLYLAIAMGVIALLKIVGCKMKKFAIELLAIVLLLVTSVTTLVQGKMGGEIVYNYGMPFKAEKTQKILKKAYANADETEDSDEKVEFYEDAIDDIDSLSQKVNKVYGLKAVEEDKE